MNSTVPRLAAAVPCAVLLCLAAPGSASAFVPQTIVIDGVNDFLAANLVENDSSDTQFAPIDLRRVYITNDANKLYFGLGQDKDGWTTVQIGIMISTLTKNGATNDMWSHRIAWAGAHTPGYGAYKNYDNNWQEFRQWTGTAWSAPLRSGPGANGMTNNTAFGEIGFLLCELGVAAGDSIWFEIVVTQDGTTKGPLDLSKHDAVQLSTPGGTVWDPPAPITVSQTWGYRIQSVGDAVRPTVTSAFKRQPFTISVVFSEPVHLATSQNPANYALAGTSAIVVDAVRRTQQCNIVDLALSQDIFAQDPLYKVTVTNVQDLAGNVILNNGTTNIAEFALKDVYFRGLFNCYLVQHSTPPNTFSVEGDFEPLTFTQTCDTGVMTNTGVNNIYQVKVEFCIEKQSGAPYAERNLQWKFMHNCTTYEPLANNREFLLTSQLGAQDTVEAYWNNEDASQTINHAVDVIFRADMNGVAAATDTVAVDGNVLPLDWNVPSANRMLDDGVAPDAVAGDKIYTKKVRFTTCALKNVEYKFLHNGGFECAGTPSQGNRNVYLNDAAFDTLGGPLGPITMPVQRFGYCQITDASIKTIWRLLVNPAAWPWYGSPSVGVRGSQPPLAWDTDLQLLDNGVAPDLVAGDDVWSGETIFPDSSYRNFEYKYAIGSVFESGFNRSAYLDETVYSVANPLVLADTLDVVTDAPPGVVARKIVLLQNQPNPFNPTTRIAFEVPRPGRYRVLVYNSLGRRVRVLLDRELPAGPGSVLWDGRDGAGTRVASGIYVYTLEDAAYGDRESRKMLLLK
jgi:hypothetical protein